MQDTVHHVEIASGKDDWVNWAKSSDINPDVISFVEKQSTNEGEVTPFVSPHHWSIISSMVSKDSRPNIKLCMCIQILLGEHYSPFIKHILSCRGIKWIQELL